MSDVEKIKAGLAKLDPNNNNHWTEDGLPRIETMRLLAGLPSLTREQINDADPKFTRQAATVVKDPAAAPAASAATSEPLVAAPAGTESAAPVRESAKDKMAALKDELDELNEELDKAHAEKVAAEQYYMEVHGRRDAVQVQIDRLQPPEHVRNMSAIQAYQAAANREREVRGEKWKALHDAGVKLRDIIPQKAPIDAARARKR